MKLYIITDSEGWTSNYIYTDLREATRHAKNNFLMDSFESVKWFTISQIDTEIPYITELYRLYRDGSGRFL